MFRSALPSKISLARWLRRWLEKPSLGELGERMAARYLKRQGYQIVGRHQRTKYGELDLVAVEGRTIVFVEVKARRSHDAGHPAEAVDARKQAQLTRLARAYLKRHGLLNHAARFDVVAITWPESGQPTIEHFKHAFEAAH